MDKGVCQQITLTMVVAVVLVDLYGIQDIMRLLEITRVLLVMVEQKIVVDLVIDKVMMVQTQLHLD